ncbi:hypothetical protein GUJ93_ZPchr0012g21389 [Zizania palustris]|uniref:VQ domain-containing protein n=1 Tax=Zizania palustris TaxID=103762 RepID=A0A8J6BT66_ZIZPA|nr:hypothetical protein GUJ93_ZPchr0420g40548 [Zizania palustris]KAG8095562.1 hypothetical protein GUJ93_ZPchr0012g21389 [Zizania palustris]
MAMEKQPARHGQAPLPLRPHWRRRDPSATEVYVVHPTQFRSVVQQLTGAPPATPDRNHHLAGGNAIASNFSAPAMAVQRRGVENDESNNGSRGQRTTLGQMYQECMAWAAQDDYDQH